MDTESTTKVVKEKKAKGFTARKGEIKAITETGKAVIQRKVKALADGSIPTLEQCPLGKVGRKVWWRENNNMRSSDALIHSVITSVDMGVDSKGRNVWMVSVDKI